MKNAKKSGFKKRFIKSVSCVLCAFCFVSLSSCDSIKLKFAGELTDKGISFNSVAKGEIYQAEAEETILSPNSYDTVFEDCLFVGNRIMCDFYSSLSQWKKNSPKLLENSLFFCTENFSVYENNYSDPESSTTPFPTITVKRYVNDESDSNDKSYSKNRRKASSVEQSEISSEAEYEIVTFKCDVATAVFEYGVKRVVICLAGINDLPVYGDEENCHKKTASEMGKLVKELKSSFEGLSIVVLSVPPISSDSMYMKSINNEKIDMLNEELSVVCTENGADFLQISHLLKDSKGGLKSEYCEDGYCKLNEEGSKIILSSLRYYAKKIKGEN